MIGIANKKDYDQSARNIVERMTVAAEVLLEKGGFIEMVEESVGKKVEHDVLEKYIVTVAIGMNNNQPTLPLEEHPTYWKLRGVVEQGLKKSGAKITAQKAMNDLVALVTNNKVLDIHELSGTGGAQVLNKALAYANARLGKMNEQSATSNRQQ